MSADYWMQERYDDALHAELKRLRDELAVLKEAAATVLDAIGKRTDFCAACGVVW